MPEEALIIFTVSDAYRLFVDQRVIEARKYITHRISNTNE